MKKILFLFLLSFIKIFSQEPTIQWGGSIGSFGYDNSQALNIDANGNLYITGGYSSTVDFNFGSGTFLMNSINQTDAFLVKYNNNGELQWGVKYGGTYNDTGFGVGFDSLGNVYSVGGFSATVDFDPGPNIFNMTASTNPYIITDIYLTKLDINGNFVFAKKIGGLGTKHASGFTVDSSGNSYITGYFNKVIAFSDTVSLTPSNGINNDAVFDIFIAKYTNSGDLLWVKQIGNGSVSQRSEDIVIDQNGNLYVCGNFTNVTDFDPSPVSNYTLTPHSTISGFSDLFILKLDNNGNFIWAKNMGSENAPTSAKKIALDQSGNTYLTGRFRGTVDFDPSNNNSFLTSITRGDNPFILKMNSNGDFQWVKHLIGGGTGNAITVNNNGKVGVTGVFYGTCDFSGGASTAIKTTVGEGDVFIAEFSVDGTFNWVKSIGGNQEDVGIDIKSDINSNYFVFGDFFDLANINTSIDNLNLSSNGSQDIFVLKISNLPLNISDFNTENFLLYPNPSQNELYIKMPDIYTGGKILIYSMNGQLLKILEVNNIVNIEDLSSGSYILKITNNANQSIEHVFIKE